MLVSSPSAIPRKEVEAAVSQKLGPAGASLSALWGGSTLYHEDHVQQLFQVESKLRPKTQLTRDRPKLRLSALAAKDAMPDHLAEVAAELSPSFGEGRSSFNSASENLKGDLTLGIPSKLT